MFFVYAANREYVKPQDVDLQFKQSNGFTASLRTNGQKERHLNEQEIIDVIAEYLQENHNFIAERIICRFKFPTRTGLKASIRIINV